MDPHLKLVDGRYAPVRPLGSGGFGSVYLVTDVRTNQRAALKFLAVGDPDAIARFRREARLLDQQRHNPHVVRILDHNLEHMPPFIVMEHCEGGSLRAWVGSLRNWRDVAAAMVHALLGLNALHEGGGFHRDLKPDNLLLAVDVGVPGGLVVKVGDFGLARAPGSRSPMTRGAGGTDGYIAPEIEAGGEYDARADIYSLGVAASELLTGSRAIEALRSATIPDRLRAIVRQMRAILPNERPRAHEIAQALQSLLKTPNVEATQEPVADESGFGPFLFAGLLVGGALFALAALAADESPAPGPAAAPR